MLDQGPKIVFFTKLVRFNQCTIKNTRDIKKCMAGRGDVFVQVDQVTVRVREGEGNRYVLFLVKLAELSFLSCCSCQKGVALRPRPAA